MIPCKFALRQNACVIRKLIPSFCFSAQSVSFTKKAKILEDLKSSSTIPENTFQQGKYMLLHRCESVCTDKNQKLLWTNFQDLQSITENHTHNQKILLDISSEFDCSDTYLFAVNLNFTTDQDLRVVESKIGGKFINARESLLKLNQRECKYVAQAKGLAHFAQTFNYCPNCGNQLVPNPIGTQKKCQKCQQVHYPYVAPVGIVLLDDVKHEKVLLVRQHRHPPGMYSCVAGFIEPGETLDQCIKREVAEEVGLDIANIEFCTSQPWAMPSSQLMLACLATVEGEKLDLDEKEILGAKWVGADALRNAISRINSWKSDSSAEFWVPPAFTASHQMMVEWLKKYHPL